MRSSIALIHACLAGLVLAAPLQDIVSIETRDAESKSAFENSLEKRQYSQTSEDDQLLGPCKALTLIFARGTFEPGNVGGVVGPPLAQDLYQLENNLSVQGVNYSANVFGFFVGGDPAGASTMAQYIGDAMTNCPDTKLAISGYSQGAQVVHNAAALLSTAETNFVTSVVTFGDPDQKSKVGNIPSNKVKIFCAQGDDICTGGFEINQAHLSYGANASEAAQFIYEMSGLGS